MLLKVIALILIIVNKSLESCVYKEGENSLKCENSSFSDIIAQYSDVKDVISLVVLHGCNKPDLKKNEIPFLNVHKLAISCDIQTLTSDCFDNFVNLHTLNLSTNRISTIPNNLYQRLSNLAVLQLSHNRLRNPTIDTFYYLNNLNKLDISFNRITNIDLGVLDLMKNLTHFNVSYNGLFTLLVGVFDEVTDLETLDLSHNNLHEIPLGVFDQSIKLTDLILAGNKFSETIQLGALDGLKNLKYLDLSASNLKNLPLGVFDQLKQLNYLSLSGNDLRNLTLGLFDELKSLVTLGLARCGLEGVVNGVFDKNKLLETLDLSRNGIRALEDGTLDDTKKLKFLNLSHNNIKGLPTNLFQQTELEVVDLSFNQMEMVQPGLLNVETLRKVIVKSNKIEFLDAKAFAAKGNPLRYIDVSQNRLVCLEPTFFNWVVNLERFQIAGNPWDCKQLDEMIRIMTSRFITYRARDYFQGQKPVCASPEGALKRCTYDRAVFQAYYILFSDA